MRNRTLLYLITGALLLSSCKIQAPAATDTPVPTGVIWPTATYRVWRTIAPDNVATSTPTPTARPLRAAPQGRIAFQSDQSGSLDIYVMNADGSQISRLTTDAGTDVFPSWSPDGKKLAFASDMDGTPDIYVMNANGTNLTKVVDDPSNDVLPAWSPDGKQLAFVSDRTGDDEIYVINVDGSGLKRLTNSSGDDDFPSWSPDGEWLVFASTRDVNSEIYKMDKNGKNLIRLTDDPSTDSTPAWSPDGTRIAFVSKRDGFANLYVMDPEGENVTQLTFYKSIVEVPTWSADSKLIAFASDMEVSRDIFIIGADGSGLDRITDLPGEEFYPAWSPDATNLTQTLTEPTAKPEDVCVNSTDPTYGYSIDNPIRIGYDPREKGNVATGCVPWLAGPQGQTLTIELLEEVDVNGSNICKVSASYQGQTEPDILYFDTNTFEQPEAPVGYSCGSPVEYLKALTFARY
jgi:TolB protein